MWGVRVLSATAHWSSDLQTPGEANRLQLQEGLLYIIYDTVTNMQWSMMHSIKAQLLAGFLTCITHRRYWLLFSSGTNLYELPHTIKGKNNSVLMCVCLCLQERRVSVKSQITCRGAWRRDVGCWKMRPANCHPTIWASLAEFITFFSPEGRFVLLAFISTLALCWCEVSALTETKRSAIWSELSLPLNYTII